MKRVPALLLVLVLVLQLAACGSGGAQNGGNTGNPGQPAEGPGNEPETGMPAYQVYVYEEGGLTIAVPWSLPAEPEQTDRGILFRDPEGAWTVRFEPLTVQDTPYRVNNTTVEVQNFQDFGYYQDVQIQDFSFGGYPARSLSFSRNPDWVEASMGWTASSFTEPHCLILVDYTDVVIANYGGLLIDVSGPEKTPGAIQPILDDEDVQTLLGNVLFAEPSTEKLASIPGITVSFPIRWSVGDDGDRTLWGSFHSEPNCTLFFSGSIYDDPQEAASTVSENVRSLDYGGRTWYGGVRHVTVSDSDYYCLELYTAFTQYHALCAQLRLYGENEAGVWAFANSELFRGILESVQLDPDAFHDPEKDRMDDTGFECNNINEVSNYTGTASEVKVPAVIGQNQMVGIQSGAFDNNSVLTKVTVEEGIQYIGYGSFENCVNLQTVILPNSITYIDCKAFAGCTSLREVRFGNCLRTIDREAFADCAALGDVLLPESLVKVGENAFRNAGDGSGSFRAPAEGVVFGRGALVSAHFDTVEFGPKADLSEDAILNLAYVNRVIIGSGCAQLGRSFLSCPTYNDDTGMWHYVDTPLELQLNGVEVIGDYAFTGREGLRAVDLSGVRELGKNAFERTGLVNITVPGSVREIPANCFSNCSSAVIINLEEGVETVGPNAFAECGRVYPDSWSLRYFTEEEAREYGDRIVPNGSPEFDKALTIYLPSTVRYVDDWAFACTFINGLYMLWCTEPDMLPEFHHDAFYACRHIHQFYFTQETIERYGDELDARLNELEDVGEPAWYYIGNEPYWAHERID